MIVEGHTDDTPIQSSSYPSNWELSTARAGSVVRYFIEEGKLPASKFMAVGFAETRPLVPNDTPENRSKNRRVNIVFVIP
jgi:chemotaxis protein MotB